MVKTATAGSYTVGLIRVSENASDAKSAVWQKSVLVLKDATSSGGKLNRIIGQNMLRHFRFVVKATITACSQ